MILKKKHNTVKTSKSNLFGTNDFIDSLSEKMQVSKKQSKDILKIIHDIFFDALKKNDKVKLGKIGTFRKKMMKKREVKSPPPNPADSNAVKNYNANKKVVVPPYVQISFRSSSETKKLLKK